MREEVDRIIPVVIVSPATESVMRLNQSSLTKMARQINSSREPIGWFSLLHGYVGYQNQEQGSAPSKVAEK